LNAMQPPPLPPPPPQPPLLPPPPLPQPPQPLLSPHVAATAVVAAASSAGWRARFRAIAVFGDGNCMFRAIAVCVGRSEDEHGAVREQVARRLLRAPLDRTGGERVQLETAPCAGNGDVAHLCQCGWDQRAGFAVNVERHSEAIRRPGVWGDAMELMVASYCFNATVEIIGVDGDGAAERQHRGKVGMYGKYMAEQYRGQRHKASHAIRLVYEVNEGREHYNAAELR